MLITPLNEIPHLTPADKQLLADLNEQIAAFNREHDEVESMRERLKGGDAADLTAEDVDTAGRLPGKRLAIQQSELRLRTLLMEWETVRRRALSVALAKAEAARDAVVAALVKKLVGLGFVTEKPIPAAGVTVPGILEQQLALHPAVEDAHMQVLALAAQRDDPSWRETNRAEIDRLTRDLDRVRARVLAAT